jgi:diguanylate cyclase (GGDEF)-like protein/PAS domain S-box-containing protein
VTTPQKESDHIGDFAVNHAIDKSALFDSLFEGLYLVDRDRRIVYWNRSAEAITGWRSEQAVGRHCFDDMQMHIDNQGACACNGHCPLLAAMKSGGLVEASTFLNHNQGHRVPVSLRTLPLRDAHGTIVGAAELIRDESPTAGLLERLREVEKLALLDPLTKLANRRYIEETIEQRCTEMKRYKWESGILFIDVDNFKSVNDTHGHTIGDALLVAVAATLVANSRPFDFFGRLGGDEFVGIIRNVGFDELKQIAEKLRMLIESQRVPAASAPIAATVSVGATLVRMDDDVHSVMKRADELMYKSKHSGKNGVHVEA